MRSNPWLGLAAQSKPLLPKRSIFRRCWDRRVGKSSRQTRPAALGPEPPSAAATGARRMGVYKSFITYRATRDRSPGDPNRKKRAPTLRKVGKAAPTPVARPLTDRTELSPDDPRR